MILSNIKGITIPEGAVKQIADRAGRVLWKGGSDIAGMAIGYTGDYTDQPDVVMSDGKTYRLLTLTGSGTLTLDASVKADVWLCAGGNGGRGSGYHGGGGGNFVQSDGLQLELSTVCVVGAGGEATTSTSFGELLAEQVTGTQQPSGTSRYASACGASGGGAGGRGTTLNASNRSGFGGGVSTVPFLDTENFDPHSAGGGGGGLRDREKDDDNSGGAGGSDGSDGESRSGTGYDAGAGGEKGGGVGGKGSTSGAGSDATFYGSGGGGGGYYTSTGGTNTGSAGGNGYQGVIYVRIPYEQ